MRRGCLTGMPTFTPAARARRLGESVQIGSALRPKRSLSSPTERPSGGFTALGQLFGPGRESPPVTILEIFAPPCPT